MKKRIVYNVYKVTNLVNGKIYVGQSKYLDYNYFGSGTYIKRAIDKHSKENFVKDVLEICDDATSLNERELFWINELKSTDKNIGYNCAKWKNPEYTDEARRRQGCKYHTDETKEKISKALMGRKFSDTHRENLRKSFNRTFQKNEDYRLKMSLAKSGNKNGMYGKHHSDETKLKISNKAKGKHPWNYKLSKPTYFKTRLLNEIVKILYSYKLDIIKIYDDIDYYIQRAKLDGVIWKHLGISLDTIKNYDITVDDILNHMNK